MNNNLKIKNLVIAASISLLSIYALQYEHKYEPNYEIIDDNNNLAFASYRDGLVYIGDKEFISNIPSINENDILVLDDRYTDNLDIKIYSSYRINDKDLRNDIICIIDEYEKKNPSNWNRSIESMRIEWFVHNLLYKLNYQTNRTIDVDFHNDEEELYNKYLLKQIFKL